MINNILKTTWPLFLGLAFLMLGNGLQGTLVSWRANFEGFSSSTTGWIMTAYYLGFLAGSLLTNKLIRQVGHIRVFAALASLASTAVLVQILLIDPIAWIFMRLITGFSFAGVYVVVESWLNARADNDSRGRILSLYMIVSYGGLAGGQLLFKVADPTTFNLFLLSSILLSVALIPLLVTRVAAPLEEESESMSVLELFRTAHTGVVSITLTSIVSGVVLGMGAVYAANAGMSISQTAVFMSVFIAMGAAAQWPVGWISDKFDRRLVIVVLCAISVALIAVLYKIDPQSNAFIVIFGLFGAAALPVYSLSIAHTNDRLRPEQMTSASSTMVLFSGIGAAAGPITVGYLTAAFGNVWFLLYLGAIHVVLGLLVLYFIFQREAVPDDEQVDHQLMASRITPVGLEAVALDAEDSGNDEDNDADKTTEKGM
ncbi:MFS transporter [Cocleimonas flava]|uniref:Putative MFS family arabinose efflux permease n=1 Tax=Cocleimonas flava TaxID=634765 RepID=A0A4R1ES19_9GAMM|nr:MFS transporter [Cocleimonas flava]TCJ83300.1 putative MFS family arabinose efflux permease [Cocleimonas flava]